VRRSSKLSTRILISQVAILAVTMIMGFALYAKRNQDLLDQQYEQRALAVAQSVAGMPQIQQALADGGSDPSAAVRTVAAQVQHSAGASYVVVIDDQGRRLSHPNPALIGQRVEEPVVALDGQSHVGIDPGSLGRSANGKTPVFSSDGAVVGEVSAGIPVQEVATAQWRELPWIGLYTVLALAFGTLVSLLLARRLKKTTFGLELHEIASLLQEREAMLYGVREGVITFDPDDRITLINDEARRLVGVGSGVLGKRIGQLLPEGRLREVLTGEQPGHDQIVLTEQHCLVVNRMRVRQGGRLLGAVVTLRDRTETEDLLRELTSTRGLTDALRAQQHEFANRMYTLMGLLELGMPEEALSYLTEVSGAVDGLSESVVAKATVASERDVTLLVSDESLVAQPLADPHAVVTILGNLIDNAIDAAALGPDPAHVTVHLLQTEEDLTIRVSDTGPGIPPGNADSIFREGFTTKPSGSAAGRGLGLALVHRVVRRLGGRASVTSGARPVFTVVLPATSTTASPEPLPDQGVRR
jgi:two-component system CitB family sensor kinase